MNTTPDAMRQFEPLLGTWQVTGGATGTVRYEWLPGRHFLLQHVDLDHDRQHIQGLEVIGRLRPFGDEPSPDVHSRFYDNTGNTLDYIYRLQDGCLHIWAGAVGSPVCFEGRLSADGRELDGAWDYAGQGGYRSLMTRRDA